MFEQIPRRSIVNRNEFYAGVSAAVSENYEDLPLNRAFLRGVDLRKFLSRAIKETFHVVHEKALRIRIGRVEAIVIDNARLRLQPFRPTSSANFRVDFLTEFSG